jgi:hypothetical protein
MLEAEKILSVIQELPRIFEQRLIRAYFKKQVVSAQLPPNVVWNY